MKPLLQVHDLRTTFNTEDGVVHAVDGVSFEVGKGETVGLVGESGCGKSVTALSILRLVPKPTGKIEGGNIIFDGVNMLELNEKQMHHLRGNRISMVFQDPMISLNPVLTIGTQVMEVIRAHNKTLSRKHAMELTISMLETVKIPFPAKRVSEYPHQLSGGMQQRVMIAMALVCKPQLLIADEPTTALDVTIQAQVLDLLVELKQQLGLSLLIITHDLGVVAEVSDRILVMYAGKIVENAPTVDIFQNPKHPYTQGLLKSIPRFNECTREQKKKLHSIAGTVPGLANLPAGCYFEPRCNMRMDICSRAQPPVVCLKQNHRVQCHLYDKARN